MTDNLLPDLTKQAYYDELQYRLRKLTLQVVTIWMVFLVTVFLFLILGLIPVIGRVIQIMAGFLTIGLLLAVPLRVTVSLYRAGRYLWFHHRPPYDTAMFRITLSHDNRTYEMQFDSVTGRAFWVGNKLFTYGMGWFVIVIGLGGLSAPYLSQATTALYSQYPTVISGGLLLLSDVVDIRLLEILRQFGDPRTIAGLSFAFVPTAFMEAIAAWNLLFAIEQEWVSGTQRETDVRETGWVKEIWGLIKLLVVFTVISILVLLGIAILS